MKTRPQAPGVSAEQLVDSDVTVAVYLLLASSGVDGTVEQLEWEILTPERPDVTEIPVTTDLVNRARAVVRDRVGAVLHDDTWAPTTNDAYCADCAFRDVCPHSRAT